MNMNQMHQQSASRDPQCAASAPPPTVRDQVEQGLELATHLRALSQNLSDAVFGVGPCCASTDNAGVDLSSSLNCIVSTLRDSRLMLEKVLESIEPRKPSVSCSKVAG